MNRYHQILFAAGIALVSIILSHKYPHLAVPLLLASAGVVLYAFRK